MTGATIRPVVETSTQSGQWFDFEMLLPNQYVGIQTPTPSGTFVHGFAPSDFVEYGTEAWLEIKQRFDFYCMVSLLPAEQVILLTQRALQFFTSSIQGQQIAVLYNYLPCFNEQVYKHHFDNVSYEKPIYQLPDAVATELNDLVQGTTPPKPEALRLAKSWAESLYGEIKAQEVLWIMPHLTVQDGGDVVFEWWNGKKSLSVYISTDEVWFLQSAGASSKQNEGNADTPEVRHRIWQWLTE